MHKKKQMVAVPIFLYKAAKLMMQPKLVFDGRNALDGEQMQSPGFRYQGVGRGLLSNS